MCCPVDIGHLRELAARGGQARTRKKLRACRLLLERIRAHRVPVPCPACGSAHTRVTTVRRGDPVRYHKCQACRHSFKSLPLVVRGEPLTDDDRRACRAAARALRA